jgi:glycosyltransferase involved in cell wall biosynthesis
MHILLPAPTLEPVGGVEVSTVQYAAELARRGHELTVVYAEDGSQRSAYEALGARLVEVPGFWIHPTAPAEAWQFATAARRVARAARADVVYLNRMEHIVWAQAAARSTGAGMVLHLHAVWRPIPAPLRRGIGHYVAVSDWVRRQWLERQVPPEQISVVHQHVSEREYPVGGLAEQRAAREELGLPAGRRIVLYYGRLDADKGVQDLFAAWRSLGLDPSRAVLAVMPSTTDETVIAQTRADAPAGTLWLERRVDVVPVLHAADLVVMPSRWDEPFGRVVIEAMSSGRPALASAVGGVPEVLSGPMSRFLFPRGDVAALEALLLDTLDWRDREPGLATECVDWVRARFDMPDKVDAVEGFLLAAAQGSQDRRKGSS